MPNLSAASSRSGTSGTGGGTGGGTPAGSGGGTGGGSGGGTGGGSGGPSGVSVGGAGFASATRIEMLLAANDVTGGTGPYAIVPLDAQTFFPSVAITSNVHADAYFDIEFVGGRTGTFTQNCRFWYHAGLHEWRLNVRSRARNELSWAQDAILVITRLTSPSPAYRIEVIQPTDSSYSTRYSALDSTARKNVTAFP